MSTKFSSDRDVIRVKSRETWRAWLAKNHGRKESVWLLFHKKHTGKTSISYDDAVEEALCFGWIDSLVKRLDEDSYIQKFTPRKKNSAWSPSNKKRVRKLVRQGLMTEAGAAKIAEAKKNGSWSRLDAVEKLAAIPRELTAALDASARAKKNFSGLAPSLRKQFLWFIETAKKGETRKKRIALTVRLAAEGKTMSDYFYGRTRR